MKSFLNFMKCFAMFFAVLFAVTSCEQLSELIGDADEDGESLGIDCLTHEVPFEGSTVTITLNTILPYSTSINEGGDWIVEQSSEEQNNVNYHYYKIAANFGAEERVGKIEFFASGNISSTVTITQSGRGSIELSLDTIDPNNLPSEDIWIFTDSKAESGVRTATFDIDGIPQSVTGEGDFYNLYNAIINAKYNGEGRDIILEFPNLKAFPVGAFYDLQKFLDYPDYESGSSYDTYGGVMVAPANSYRAPSILYISAPAVTSIGDFAFANTEFVDIDMPKIESLGKFAFANAIYQPSYLKTFIAFPKIKEIKQGSFMKFETHGSGQTKVIFPEVTKIGEAAFYEARIDFFLTDSKPEEGYDDMLAETGGYYNSFPKVESIDRVAFMCASYIKDIHFPAVKTIEDYAFRSASIGDDSILLPELESIGVGAFYYCSKIKSFHADKLTVVGAKAFNGCKNLYNFDAPMLHTIGSNAFYLQGSNLRFLSICYGKGVTAKSFAADMFGLYGTWNNFLDNTLIYTGKNNGTVVTENKESSFTTYYDWAVPNGFGGTNTFKKLRMQLAND